MSKVNKMISNVGRNRFEEILTAGEFPEVGFKVSDTSRSYSLIPYSTIYARFMTVVDERLKPDFADGIFTSNRVKRQEFVDKVNSVIAGVTADDIRNQPKRFRTFLE